MAHGKPITYICNTCNTNTITPVHCGKPMIVDIAGTSSSWICWKGDHEPCCGSEAVQPFKACCDTPDMKIGLNLEDANVLM